MPCSYFQNYHTFISCHEFSNHQQANPPYAYVSKNVHIYRSYISPNQKIWSHMLSKNRQIAKPKYL